MLIILTIIGLIAFVWIAYELSMPDGKQAHVFWEENEGRTFNQRYEEKYGRKTQ